MSIRIAIIFTRIQGLLKADLGADLMDTKNTDKAMQSFLNSLHITHYLITFLCPPESRFFPDINTESNGTFEI